MKRLSDSELDSAIAYRPYKRPRLWMGPANAVFCIMVFWGGSVVYEQAPPALPKIIVTKTKIMMEPNGSLPALTEEELINLDMTQ